MQSTKLFINGTPGSFSETELYDVFEKYGKIVSYTIKFGYIFVEYENQNQAEDCITALNGTYLKNKRLTIKYSQSNKVNAVTASKKFTNTSNFSNSPSLGGNGYNNSFPKSSRLYVTGYPEGTTQQDIFDYFSEIGNIVKTHFYDNKSYCFLEYESQNEAESAINQMHGNEFQGKILTVNYATHNSNYTRSNSPTGKQRLRSRSRSPINLNNNSNNINNNGRPFKRFKYQNNNNNINGSMSGSRSRSVSRSRSRSIESRDVGMNNTNQMNNQRGRGRSRTRSRSRSPNNFQNNNFNNFNNNNNGNNNNRFQRSRSRSIENFNNNQNNGSRSDSFERKYVPIKRNNSNNMNKSNNNINTYNNNNNNNIRRSRSRSISPKNNSNNNNHNNNYYKNNHQKKYNNNYNNNNANNNNNNNYHNNANNNYNNNYNENNNDYNNNNIRRSNDRLVSKEYDPGVRSYLEDPISFNSPVIRQSNSPNPSITSPNKKISSSNNQHFTNELSPISSPFIEGSNNGSTTSGNNINYHGVNVIIPPPQIMHSTISEADEMHIDRNEVNKEFTQDLLISNEIKPQISNQVTQSPSSDMSISPIISMRNSGIIPSPTNLEPLASTNQQSSLSESSSEIQPLPTLTTSISIQSPISSSMNTPTISPSNMSTSQPIKQEPVQNKIPEETQTTHQPQLTLPTIIPTTTTTTTTANFDVQTEIKLLKDTITKGFYNLMHEIQKRESANKADLKKKELESLKNEIYQLKKELVGKHDYLYKKSESELEKRFTNIEKRIDTLDFSKKLNNLETNQNHVIDHFSPLLENIQNQVSNFKSDLRIHDNHAMDAFNNNVLSYKLDQILIDTKSLFNNSNNNNHTANDKLNKLYDSITKVSDDLFSVQNHSAQQLQALQQSLQNVVTQSTNTANNLNNPMHFGSFMKKMYPIDALQNKIFAMETRLEHMDENLTFKIQELKEELQNFSNQFSQQSQPPVEEKKTPGRGGSRSKPK